MSLCALLVLFQMNDVSSKKYLEVCEMDDIELRFTVNDVIMSFLMWLVDNSSGDECPLPEDPPSVIYRVPGGWTQVTVLFLQPVIPRRLSMRG